MSKTRELFEKELNLIENVDFRNEVINILENHVHFDNFRLPSSSTMKYHPDFDNIEYGNINHTKAVVKLCTVFLNTRDDLKKFSDMIYAGAILHDMWKYDGRSRYTAKDHSEKGYNFVKNVYKPLKNTTEVKDFLKGVAILIKYHQGHWCYVNNDAQWFEEVKNMGMNTRDSVMIVHYADMVASRNWYFKENCWHL